MGLIGRFIGIDRYQDKGIDNLCGAKRDAQSLYGVFSDSFSDIDVRFRGQTTDESLSKPSLKRTKKPVFISLV